MEDGNKNNIGKAEEYFKFLGKKRNIVNLNLFESEEELEKKEFNNKEDVKCFQFNKNNILYNVKCKQKYNKVQLEKFYHVEGNTLNIYHFYTLEEGADSAYIILPGTTDHSVRVLELKRNEKKEFTNIKEKGIARFLKFIDITHQYIKKKREERKRKIEQQGKTLNIQTIKSIEIQNEIIDENQNEIKNLIETRNEGRNEIETEKEIREKIKTPIEINDNLYVDNKIKNLKSKENKIQNESCFENKIQNEIYNENKNRKNIEIEKVDKNEIKQNEIKTEDNIQNEIKKENKTKIENKNNIKTKTKKKHSKISKKWKKNNEKLFEINKRSNNNTKKNKIKNKEIKKLESNNYINNIENNDLKKVNIAFDNNEFKKYDSEQQKIKTEEKNYNDIKEKIEIIDTTIKYDDENIKEKDLDTTVNKEYKNSEKRNIIETEMMVEKEDNNFNLIPIHNKIDQENDNKIDQENENNIIVEISKDNIKNEENRNKYLETIPKDNKIKQENEDINSEKIPINNNLDQGYENNIDMAEVESVKAESEIIEPVLDEDEKEKEEKENTEEEIQITKNLRGLIGDKEKGLEQENDMVPEKNSLNDKDELTEDIINNNEDKKINTFDLLLNYNNVNIEDARKYFFDEIQKKFEENTIIKKLVAKIEKNKCILVFIEVLKRIYMDLDELKQFFKIDNYIPNEIFVLENVNFLSSLVLLDRQYISNFSLVVKKRNRIDKERKIFEFDEIIKMMNENDKDPKNKKKILTKVFWIYPYTDDNYFTEKENYLNNHKIKALKEDKLKAEDIFDISKINIGQISKIIIFSKNNYETFYKRFQFALFLFHDNFKEFELDLKQGKEIYNMK